MKHSLTNLPYGCQFRTAEGKPPVSRKRRGGNSSFLLKNLTFLLAFFFLFNENSYTQSANCNCAGTLLTNGTFESSSLSGWSASGSANINFESGYDDCGAKSLRLSRGSGSGLLDPAIWQQENNIEAGKIYSLSFDAGTKDPLFLHRVYLRFFDASGSLLSQEYLEVNHDVDSDNSLKSYTFSLAAPANASYLRVELAIDNQQLFIDNMCLVRASCTAPTFSFQSPTLISGSASQVGAVYEFLNVVTGTNALMTIVSKSHADVVVQSVDEPAITNGGYDWAFQPIIDYNYYNGGGPNDPAGDKSVTFRFDFVDAFTGELVYIPQLNVTGVDIDGNGETIREFIETSNFNYYEVQSPTELTLSGSLRALGNTPAWPGVTETALTTMISYVYNGQSSVEITYGSQYNGGWHNSDASEDRLNCLYFKCYDFNTTVACPTIITSGGNAVCFGNSLTLQVSNSGGNGTCSLQWQSSTDGNIWANISGATNTTYTTPNLATTTYYRAIYTCTGSACGTIISNVTTATVLTTCAEICNNNIDDDGDGYIDENDADCASFENCEATPGQNTITGTVYNDANTNLNFDNGEYTPAGVAVDIYEDVNSNGSIGGSDVLVGTAITGQNGNYAMNVNPVFVQTYDARISDPCNDAKDGNETENKIQFGKDKDIGLRFTGINIPSGATINSAYLYFVSNNNQGKTGSVNIYGEDKKFPQNFCTNDDVNGRTRTSASVNWSVGNWQEDQTYQSKDIKSLVQELVSSYGNYNNNDMSFIMISTGAENVEAKTYETNGSSAEAPRLVINFTANNTVKYLARIDISSLPAGTSLNSSSLASVSFTTTSEADCNNNFSFVGSFEICDNGIDDDFDGYLDENDVDCFAPADCTATPDQNEIVGTVYQDANRNQVIDNGDAVQSGVTLRLYEDDNGNGQIDAGDSQLQTDVSDVNGYYSFTVNPVFSAIENSSINDACNDGRDGNNGENRIQFGKDKDVGVRFTGINIPAGSVINSAFLYFTANSNQSNSGSVNIYGENQSAPVSFCSDNKVTTRSRTSASVTWNIGNWVQETEYQSADITNVIQELVDSYGTYSNETMSFILISTGDNNMEAKTWETNGDGTDVPRLVIEYSPVTTISYIVSVDQATLPANTDMTTSEVATASFTVSGTADCNNDFGFTSSVEICDNGVDDDGDGLIDCDDPDCSNGLTINASGPGAPMCPGTAVTLSVSGSGGTAPYTYNWGGGLGAGASKNVNPLNNSTYTVTLTDANGCSVSSLVSVNVQACPEDCSNGIDDDLDNLTDCEDPDCNNNLAISISGGGALCKGSSASLTVNASGGNGSYSYTWSNLLGGGTTKTVSPQTDKTYYVTVSDGNGCSKIDSVFVDVKSIPEATATGGLSICAGNSAAISVSATGGDAPYTFDWSNGLGSGSNKSVNPLTTTLYTVTVTSNNGCTDTDQVTITVNQTPVISAGADVSICNSFSTTLSATATGGTPPYSYNWDQSLGSGATKTVTPIVTTSYNLLVMSANGCNATDQVTVTVQACAEDCGNGLDDDGDGLTDCDDPDCGPTVNAGTDVNICAGANTILAASVAGGTSPYTYTWSNGLGVGQTKNVSPIANATYYVTVTSQSGCTSVDNVVVSVVSCGEDCTNGIDDDGDGLVDCDDPDCSATGAPNLEDDTYTSCPGIPFSDRVTYNDDNLQNPSYSIYTNPTTGLVSIDQTGKFTYSPFNTECQVIQFSYQVCNQTTGCCSQANVTINLGDVTDPILNNVPADITISCDDAVPLPPNIVAFDECPGIYMDFDETSTQHYVGACEAYTITRTWTATDLCGNSTSNSQNITIIDNTKPEIFQVYTLENGNRVVAGVVKNVTHDWKYVPFPITFSETPMIFTTVVSNIDQSAVSVRQRNAYSQGFEIRLFEQESEDNQHKGESVSWIAIESGGSSQALKLEVGRWQNIDHNIVNKNFTNIFWDSPGMITTVQSTNDTDPSSIRINSLTESSLSLRIQEETSADAETNHGLEHVGYLAFRVGEDMTDNRGNSFGETGKTNLTNAWTTISLGRYYTKPVVVFGGISNNDADPVNVRVRNVTNNSFEVRLQEWDYLDGNHGSEYVSWMVLEGAIPGNMDYYCSSMASELKVGVNVFAIDNCDDQTAFGYTETPSNTGSGTLTTRAWMAIDDCGNTNLITRYDTCSTAALYARVKLHGATVNNGNSGLMRDDLRAQEFVPLEEPFSSLPGFPNVVDTTPHGIGNGGNNGNGGSNNSNKVTICHKPGTSSETTLEININALQAHLNHGDTEGACTNVEIGTPAGAASADYQTIADGDWDSASTWQNGSIPPSSNVNGKTIAIQHQVTLSSNNFKLKGGSILWFTNGGLTINGSDLLVENAEIFMTGSDLTLSSGSLKISNSAAELALSNSTIDVGGDIIKSGGHLWVENVCMHVGGDFENQDGLLDLINSCAIINGSFANSSNEGVNVENAKLDIKTGNFTNSLFSKLTGDSLIVWVETGLLSNLGSWLAPIDQYCIGGSALGLGSLLPIAEDCAGMADYFLTCNSLIPPDIIPNDPVTNELSTAEIALSGTLDPVLLSVTGDDAIVDWLLLEIRDPATEEIIEYATVALQRDGDIMSEDGQDLINFPTLVEGDYLVSIRHRNHLPLMTDVPIFLSIINPPMLDFTDPDLPVRGGAVGGRIDNGVRMLWGGDFNEDNKVIYQGPNNDIFYLFSRALSDPNNKDILANYIVSEYDVHDFNLDGKVIYQGPNNDRASLLYHTVLAHSGNGGFLANFIARGFLP